MNVKEMTRAGLLMRLKTAEDAVRADVERMGRSRRPARWSETLLEDVSILEALRAEKDRRDLAAAF